MSDLSNQVKKIEQDLEIKTSTLEYTFRDLKTACDERDAIIRAAWPEGITLPKADRAKATIDKLTRWAAHALEAAEAERDAAKSDLERVNAFVADVRKIMNVAEHHSLAELANGLMAREADRMAGWAANTTAERQLVEARNAAGHSGDAIASLERDRVVLTKERDETRALAEAMRIERDDYLGTLLRLRAALAVDAAIGVGGIFDRISELQRREIKSAVELAAIRAELIAATGKPEDTEDTTLGIISSLIKAHEHDRVEAYAVQRRLVEERDDLRAHLAELAAPALTEDEVGKRYDAIFDGTEWRQWNNTEATATHGPMRGMNALDKKRIVAFANACRAAPAKPTDHTELPPCPCPGALGAQRQHGGELTPSALSALAVWFDDCVQRLAARGAR